MADQPEGTPLDGGGVLGALLDRMNTTSTAWPSAKAAAALPQLGVTVAPGVLVVAKPRATYTGSIPLGTPTLQPDGGVRVWLLKLKLPPVGAGGALLLRM